MQRTLEKCHFASEYKFSTWVRMSLKAISECGQKVAVRNRGQMLSRSLTSYRHTVSSIPSLCRSVNR